MGTHAFSAPGRFWRGNIHTHSTLSDGRLEPEAVCRRCSGAGYDFLCLSDHFRAKYDFPIADTRAFRTERFTTIPGAELHAPANSQGEIWHILATGLPLDFAPPGEAETGVDLAARAKAAGAFIGIAHPQWSSLTAEDGRAIAPHAHAVKIYNHGCAVETARPDGACLLDLLLNEGHRLTGYAAVDAHFNVDDGFGAWMMVKAESNRPDALIAAMPDGDFYSSQGPLIHAFAVEGGVAHVECSPAVNVVALGRGSRAVNCAGRHLTAVRLSLDRFAGDWFRLVVSDAAGRLAWTNPVWLD